MRGQPDASRPDGLPMQGRAAFALMVVLAVLATSCTFARMFYFNVPSLAAPTYFPSRRVGPSRRPNPLRYAAEEACFRLDSHEQTQYRSFDRLLETNHTGAFLVLHNGVIVYERYFGGITETTLLPAFSMSKTYAAVLVGHAVQDGLIPSVDSRLVDFVPELATRPGYNRITLEHLLRMTAGIDFDEESFDGGAFYYGTDLRARMYAYDVKWAPGRRYRYGSINAQLLWDVLHRRLGDRTVSKYFEESVWDRMGAQDEASWSLDSVASGIEKLAGGFNATARDHAKLGQLFLEGGSLQGRTVVSREWVEQSLSRDPVAGVVHTSDGTVWHGKYQWFLTLDGRNYFAKGYQGQYVFVVPHKHAVFVRFGEGYGKVDWTSLFVRLAHELDRG